MCSENSVETSGVEGGDVVTRFHGQEARLCHSLLYMWCPGPMGHAINIC